MKAKPLKSLKFSCTFRSNQELLQIMEFVRKEIRQRGIISAGHVRGHRYKFEVLGGIITPEESRIDSINGNKVQIIPSKMNNNEQEEI